MFPTFLFETRKTMARVQSFALNTDPLLRELEPVALALGPTMHAVQELSPSLRSLFVELRPLIQASMTGLPAIASVLHGASPVLDHLGPFLEQLNPVLTWLSLHQQLTSDFITQLGTALSAKITHFGGTGHYLRTISPLGRDTVTLNGTRSSDNRGNTYIHRPYGCRQGTLRRRTSPIASFRRGTAGTAARRGQAWAARAATSRPRWDV